MRKLLSNTLFQGSIFLTGSTFLMGIINYFFSIFAARLVGPAGYGEITTLFAYIVLFTTPLTALTNVMIADIGKRTFDGTTPWRFYEALFITFCKKYWYLLLIAVAGIPFAPLITRLSPEVGYSLIPIILYLVVATVYDGILQGTHRLGMFSLANIFSMLVKLVGVGIAFFSPHPMYAIVFGLHLAAIAKITIARYFLQKSDSTEVLSPHARYPSITITDIYRYRPLWIAIGAVAAITILNNIDMIIVKQRFSAYDAGLYAAWALYAKITFYVISPLLTVSYIFFASRKYEKYHKIGLIGGIVVCLIVALSTFFVYSLFGKLMIEFIVGKKFLAIAPILAQAGIFGGGYIMLYLFNNYFLAKGRSYSLVLACMLPLYIVALLVYPKSISQVVHTNILFIFTVVIVYVFLFATSYIRKRNTGDI